MLFLWRIRYLDRQDRTFKDRDLVLDTKTLPHATRCAVELAAESKGSIAKRQFIKFRGLFREQPASRSEDPDLNISDDTDCFCLVDYFEDETGAELTGNEMGRILTGSPTAVLLPRGANQNDIDYMFSESLPVPVAEVALAPDEIRLFGYFVRDLNELRNSALIKEGAGTISSGPLSGDGWRHTTSVTDDEIRSFITIFRRLHMAGEPANFVKTAGLFKKCLGDHRLGRWVNGMAAEFDAHLQGIPDLPFVTRRTEIGFNVKRLIDVFLYTQYAHQPSVERQRQFTECLQQVGGKRDVLCWLFLTEVWKCGLQIQNAGKVIESWFKSYCDHHGITPDVLNSLRAFHAGLGISEKHEVRKARMFREKVEEIELQLWKDAGRPEGGPVQFRLLAQDQLKLAMGHAD